MWVHGTRFIRRPLFHSFFNGQPNLRLAQDLAHDYHLHQVTHQLHTVAPDMFPLETLYLFGWSGKLDAQVREEAAQALYTQLHELRSAYKQQHGEEPFIRLICHSHGGNVALSLAKFKYEKSPLHINELILLACPVQEKTKRYVEDPMFGKTIAIYSTLDMVQVLAPQVVYNVYRTKKGNLKSTLCWPPLSSRRFDHHPKIAQVKVKLNGRALFHTEFARKKFASLLPHILHVIEAWKIERLEQFPVTHLLCVYTRKEDFLSP